MDAPEQLQQVLAFMEAKDYLVTLGLATFAETESAPTCRSLAISDGVADGFSTFAAEVATKLSRMSSSGDLRLLKYSAGYKPDDHEVEYIDTSEDDLPEVVSAIPSPAHIPLVGDLEQFVDQVRFYFLILSGGNRRVVLFRRYSRNKELKRSKNLVMRLMGERFERITEPTFQFDPGFDAILFKDTIYILNKSNFQHIFRYFEKLRKVATDSLKAISDVIPIANFPEFSASCTAHLQKLEKLRNIARKPYLASVTMKEIKKTIRDFKLSAKVARVDGKEQLVFDAKDRWAILNLLDDAYLGSAMTGFRYEANSKRQL